MPQPYQAVAQELITLKSTNQDIKDAYILVHAKK